MDEKKALHRRRHDGKELPKATRFVTECITESRGFYDRWRLSKSVLCRRITS